MSDLEWRPVPGFEEIYAISSAGDVKRICPGVGRAREGAILRPGRNPKGYQAVNLFCEGRGKTAYIHVIVCEAFHGPRPSLRHQAAHRDDDKDNNTPANLYWATPLENHADRRRNGRILVGSQIGRSKLTEANVRAIRMMRANGDGQSTIAKRFDIAPHTVSRILSGLRWGHLA